VDDPPSGVANDSQELSADFGLNEEMAGFVRVCASTALPDPGKEVFEVDDRFVLVIHLDGEFFAMDDVCTHDGGPLGEGDFDGWCVVCPRHGAKFDIRTGAAMRMPAVRGTAVYPVRLYQDDVYVKLQER
jgi:3-phenylpropionate/trans-cinnamate dioxygenase ferredoxin component